MEMLHHPNADHPITMHIYGDSILKGVIQDEETGMYHPMKKDDFAPLCAQHPITVVNRSKFGATIGRGWAFLSRALEKQTVCDLAVLEFGGNDCNFDWKAVSDNPGGSHLPMTEPEIFADTLRRMTAALRGSGIRPVLVSLPPIHAQRYFDHILASTPGTNGDRILAWLGGDVQMIYRYQELYSAAVTRIAYETGSIYLDLRSAFLDKHGYGELLCADGIHPNEAGHALIADAFLRAADVFTGVGTEEKQTA